MIKLQATILFSLFCLFGLLYGSHPNFTKVENTPQTRDKKDEKLRLIYQVFLYSNDIKNAYKTAKLALKRRPNSLYWHYKMAEVASWLGKGAEAVRSMGFVYKYTHNPKMKKKILKSALQLYQYKIAAPLIREETMKNPTPKNIENMIFVYNKIGKPEIAGKVLEKLATKSKKSEDLLREALKIYILLGEQESAKRIITKLEKLPKLKEDTAREISYFYIPKKRLKKAYEALLKAWSGSSSSEGYLIQMSDLGWYLKDFSHSAKASQALIKQNRAREVDYDRVVNFYGKKNPAIAQKVAIESFKKYHKPYLLSSYMSLLLSQKKYKKLYQTTLLIDKSPKLHSYFKDRVEYYLIKAETLKALKMFDRAEEAYKRAIKLKPNSPELKLALFWLFIESKDTKRLKRLMFDIEENLDIDSSYWLPLGMGHYFLNEVDRAINYISLVRGEKKSIESDITYAYLLQLQGEREGFNRVMKNLFEYLDNKLQREPKLLKNREFLTKYLESGLYFLEPNRFLDILKSSKNIIGREKYQELSLSFSQRHNSTQMTKIISNRLSTPKPWIDMSVAMAENDYSKAQKLLYRYYLILPPTDSAVVAKKSGNIAFAQTLAFDAQERNRKNSTIYKLRRDYIEEYVDRLNFSSGFDKLGDINNIYFKGDTLKYIARGYYIKGAFRASKNIDKSSKYPNNIPKSDNQIEIGVKKIFERGFVELDGGFRAEAKDYFYLLLSGEYKATDKLLLKGSIDSNARADETTYLRLGGKKDKIDFEVIYYYLSSTMVSLYTSYDKFYSQDGVYLGDGYSARVAWSRLYRSAYPDIRVNLFTEYGDFSPTAGDRGVIDDISQPTDKILPDEYLRLGSTFSIGSSTKDIYTRVWRGYAEITPYYDWFSKGLDFSLNAGYGGSLFGQDKLRFDLKYDQSLNGTDDANYGLNMNYKLLY